MGNMISFAEILGAIFMSFAVALTLQWIGLVALMRLMPAKKADVQRAEMETFECTAKGRGTYVDYSRTEERGLNSRRAGLRRLRLSYRGEELRKIDQERLLTVASGNSRKKRRQHAIS